jgi:hypothetical protein
MPIDLKIVRSHPELVKEWQRQRQRGDETRDVIVTSSPTTTTTSASSSTCKVDRLVQQDDYCRRALHDLNAQRALLKRLQQSLRPCTNNTSDNSNTTSNNNNNNNNSQTKQEIRKQIQMIQTTLLPKLQDEWKAATNQVDQLLVQLASPVDKDVLQNIDIDTSQRMPIRINRKDKEVEQRNTLETPSTSTPSHPSSKHHQQQQQQQPSTFSFSSNVGLDIAQAFGRVAIRHFSNQYSSIRKINSHVRVVDSNNSSSTSTSSPPLQGGGGGVAVEEGCLDATLAHKMWGCLQQQQQQDDDDDYDGTATAACCAICEICSGTTARTTTMATAKAALLLPAWLGIVADQAKHAQKTIYGDKQLPLYLCLWTTPTTITTTTTTDDCRGDTIQILAMTPATLWDSRSIQTSLLRELLEFLTSFWSTATATSLDDGDDDDDDDDDAIRNTLQIRAVEPCDLALHEVSRIVIECKYSNSNNNHNNAGQRQRRRTLLLGSVSNFGDSAGRSCGMEFAGGGSRCSSAKDYVHLVHAALCKQATLEWILWCSSKKRQGREKQTQTQDQKVVGIPNSIVQEMIKDPIDWIPDAETDEYGDCVWIPAKELVETSPQAFGFALKSLHKSQSGALRGDKDAGSTTKVHVLTSFPVTPEQARLEALATPFDFLF